VALPSGGARPPGRPAFLHPSVFAETEPARNKSARPASTVVNWIVDQIMNNPELLIAVAQAVLPLFIALYRSTQSHDQDAPQPPHLPKLEQLEAAVAAQMAEAGPFRVDPGQAERVGVFAATDRSS